MTHRLSSPPLIKGIDGIVSRSPNKVNYSTLNGKRMESGKQSGNEIRQKYRKYGISGNMAKYVKQEENDGKTRILNQRGNENETELVENKVEYDGEEKGATRKAQLQKCKNLKPNTDSTNVSIYSCTSASRIIDNGKVTNTETKSETTNR